MRGIGFIDTHNAKRLFAALAADGDGAAEGNRAIRCGLYHFGGGFADGPIAQIARQGLAQEHIVLALHGAFDADDVGVDLGEALGRDQVGAVIDHALGWRSGFSGFLHEGAGHGGMITQSEGGWDSVSPSPGALRGGAMLRPLPPRERGRANAPASRRSWARWGGR